jgi:5,10-methylenetetrahydrofolate reductase
LKFREKLKSGKFIITAELYPPKGADISAFLKRAACLDGVDAVNVTDNQRASMRAGSLAMSKILLDTGIEPIMQLACRDKNRIALQSELLSANILGIENALIISGDHPDVGEYAGTKAVYDLDTVQLIKAARLLETGTDLAGKKLSGSPAFCLGAAVNPLAQPNELQIIMYEKKIKASAEFFQTQTIFDAKQYGEFHDKIKHFAVKTLPGIMLIKSPKFMNFLGQLPGVNIPPDVRARINNAADPLEEGMRICAETIKELRSFADGAHIMAIGMEEYIPQIIKNSL